MKFGVSYFGNKIPEHIKEDFSEIKSAGFSFIVLTFDESDMQFYAETFIKIVRIAHDLSLKVYIDPWGVGRVFGGEAYSNFTNLYPETKQVLFSGRIAPCACINNKKFLGFIEKWVIHAISTGADGIFWDEPHYFLDWEGIGDNSWACRCIVCQEMFNKKYGYKMPAQLTDDVRKFRQDSMYDFLKYICDFAKKKGIKENVICLLPRRREKAGTKDWNRIAAINSLDILSTTAYYILAKKDMSYVTKTTTELLNMAKKHNKEAMIWIQLFGIPKGKVEEIRKTITLVVELKVNNIAFWSYKAADYMSHFLSHNPEKVWKIVCDEVKKQHKI